MEVKINCSCGEKYAFDIEPVDGQMPTRVNCPKCGAEGTEQANRFIAEHTHANRPSSLTLKKEVPPTSEESGIDVPNAVPEEATGFRQDARGPSLLLGSIGAIAAGAIGMGAWYYLVILTGYELGIAAWGIGLLIGFATLLLARGGSQALGFVAGACALIAIVGGQFLVLKSYTDEYFNEMVPGAYDAQLEFAQKAVAAENDDELRSVLADNYADYGEDYEAIEISDEELAEFRETTLPQLQSFVDGDPSREEYEASIRAVYGSPEVNFAMLKESMSLFTLLWLFLGVGSAYKLALGNEE